MDRLSRIDDLISVATLKKLSRTVTFARQSFAKFLKVSLVKVSQINVPKSFRCMDRTFFFTVPGFFLLGLSASPFFSSSEKNKLFLKVILKSLNLYNTSDTSNSQFDCKILLLISSKSFFLFLGVF